MTFFSFLFLQCWDECTSSTSINKSILDTWSLSVQSMVRDNSLVSTNIAWTATKSPSDCLVTWEVSGGGLIGNLLTQSSNVELSLWPETKYRIQVTCKNKVSNQVTFCSFVFFLCSIGTFQLQSFGQFHFSPKLILYNVKLD